MAVAEHEITQQLTLTLSGDLHEKMEQAALASGQTVGGFIVSSLRQAAESALTPIASLALPPAKCFASILGIFKDEPMLDDLMEHIHEQQRLGIEQFRAEEAAEEAAAEAKNNNVFA